MAVLSRPSLRSSARKGADPELRATEKPLQPSDSRKGKRARLSPISPGSDASSKKLKTDPQSTARKVSRQKRDALKSLPFRARQPLSKDVVTQDVKSRKLDPVLVQPKDVYIPPPIASDDSIHYGINQNLPPPAPDQVERRSLRSHDGASRSKSELAQYFSNYDELISIGIREPDILTPEAVLYISDESSNPPSAARADPTKKPTGKGRPPAKENNKHTRIHQQCMEWPDEDFTTLTNATRIEFPDLDHRTKQPTKDPLDDSIYCKAHAREERKEKQLRNIEKERAMHEKVQLERLLDGLRGHDWLRVMGISGITDGEKKAYEPKRDYLIQEVRALLEKFRLWKEEEKRRKAEKEEEMEEDSDEEEGEDDDIETGDEADSTAESDSISDGDPPDYSDVDASAARQLRMEALLATDSHKRNKFSKHPHSKPGPKPLSREPFKSFYAKPYLRAAAIGKHRRSGRSRMAFGQPIPEVDERTFELPKEIKSTEALLESGRRMRRSKREGKEQGDV